MSLHQDTESSGNIILFNFYRHKFKKNNRKKACHFGRFEKLFKNLCLNLAKIITVKGIFHFFCFIKPKWPKSYHKIDCDGVPAARSRTF